MVLGLPHQSKSVSILKLFFEYQIQEEMEEPVEWMDYCEENDDEW